MTMRLMNYTLLALPLALAISACGADHTEENQEAQTEAATLEQPGFDGTPATPEEARTEALELAGHLAAGDLSVSEAEIVLNDLSTLINDHIGDFPAETRVNLTQDIESAQSALESDYMQGVAEAAAQIENRITGADSTATADTAAAAE
ncbi:hypothetical protein [Aurantiacibacter rhizosphaerae]|uniref:Uncharacterized protein n=1 Tax=Aurantiacibacter rhizosphaerae TaxID=2691582 RepID=A0A844X8T0_9SPHN|nr:hypothetical protein [Aurantiacibacter rhizosphaerae]MWV26376.1 hypothetical protein [Aurantiacibacter rhizosphaerae]